MRALGCPLCGGKASVEAFEMRWGENAGKWYGYIECDCGLSYSTPDYYEDDWAAKADAVKNWNTRWTYTAGSKVVVEELGD